MKFTGVEEYCEAVIFWHYLLNRDMITHKQVQGRLQFGPDEFLPLQRRHYILGLCDFTGELMRYCVNSVSENNLQLCFEIKEIFQNINAGFLSLPDQSKDLKSKISVFHSSMHKVEDVCYSIQLRKLDFSQAKQWFVGDTTPLITRYLQLSALRQIMASIS